jgi:glycosyltransferase involved in cell wall biosynthesis
MPLYPHVAQVLEPIVLRGAAGVVVLNEFVARAYRGQYGVNPTIIRVPLQPEALEGEFDAPWPAEKDELRIVFTGQIYDINLDAVHNMIEAINQLGRPEVKLHVYTAQPWEELEARGVRGPVVFHEQLPPLEFFAMQRRADILFMPLAFESPYPEIVRTTAPGKLPEYLASGRPILAHAPANSFAAWYVNRHQCGVFVDRREAAPLVQAIRRICQDADLRQRLRERAQALARTDFTLDAAHARWVELLQSHGSRPQGPRVKR